MGTLLRSTLGYLRYILKHKWYVFLECRKFGLTWLGIIHDWSKFTPTEWGAYRRWFYTDKQWQAEYDQAWLAHLHRNKHHWQYWILIRDSGKIEACPMPDKYREEMLADWLGASRAQKAGNLEDWYLKRREGIILHQETREWLEEQLF